MRMKGVHVHGHGAFSSSSSNNTTTSGSRRSIKLNSINNNGYMVTGILMLVFGVGILGVMGIHRVRERRFYDLTIKDKEQQVLSLHSLLQKEKEHVQEYKKKTAEMKTKIYSLRNQMSELNARVMEMQTTITSLKDEQKIIEKAFEEKQNEATSLRERYIELKDRHPQVKTLTELLQQKEAELEELKHNLQTPAIKAPAENVTGDQTGLLENRVISNNQTDVSSKDLHEPSEREGKDNLDKGGNETKPNDNNEPRESRDPKSIETAQEKPSDGTAMLGNSLVNEEKKLRDESTEANFTKQYAQTQKSSNSQEVKNQKPGEIEGGEKLEIQEKLHGGKRSDRRKGKRGYLKRAKANRWKPMAKQTESNADNFGEEKIIDQVKMRDSVIGSSVKNEPVLENQQFGTEDKVPDDAQGKDKDQFKGYSDIKSGNVSEESLGVKMFDDGKIPVKTDNMNYKNASLESHTSIDEEPNNAAIDEMESRSMDQGVTQHIDKENGSNDQVITAGENTENRKSRENDRNFRQTKVSKSSDDTKIAPKLEVEETEPGTSTSKEYEQRSEEENEENKEHRDEPEF